MSLQFTFIDRDLFKSILKLDGVLFYFKSGLESRMGLVDVQSDRVSFMVSGALNPTEASARMRFAETIVNDGGAMNAETGIFTAPKAGIYQFSFLTSNGNQGSGIECFIRRNTDYVSIFTTTTSNSYESISTSLVLRLNVGDEIDVFIRAGAIMNDNYRRTVFSGSLLTQDIVIW